MAWLSCGSGYPFWRPVQKMRQLRSEIGKKTGVVRTRQYQAREKLETAGPDLESEMLWALADSCQANKQLIA
jgi:hypothetical protein